MKTLCSSLLESWCEALLRLQIKGTGSKALDGALICPACGAIHGRCFEAMYPFLHMAKVKKSEEYIKAAENLFIWAQNNMSQSDGSFLNDISSNWKGTTVFNTIQLAECLIMHKDILSPKTAHIWEKRLEKAADFLYKYEELKQNNINYPLTNALALQYCGKIFNKAKYIKKAQELAQMAAKHITENGLIFGEGVPKNKRSAKGCAPVDIGYNVEETLPALALYAVESENEEVLKLAYKGLLAHLPFMLGDGGWDNSFGTRNFKWSYWGSRTSDGCQLGYLLFANTNPSFGLVAKKNLKLLNACTEKGLLYGGPHYVSAGEQPCVHHTFTHAKVLAAVLDKKLEMHLESTEKEQKPNEKVPAIKHYPEIATWRLNKNNFTATITAYDWEYMQGGHVSGGTLSMLYHQKIGAIFCAGMGEYYKKEPENMQTPRTQRHECLALRVEIEQDSVIYSSMYDDCARVQVINGIFFVKGQLCDIAHNKLPNREAAYSFKYSFAENIVEIEAEFEEGRLICPLLSRADEKLRISKNSLTVYKKEGVIKVKNKLGKMRAIYGEERIFNLIPGFQALRLDVLPENNKAYITIDVL